MVLSKNYNNQKITCSFLLAAFSSIIPMSYSITELTPSLLRTHKDDYFTILQNLYATDILDENQALAVLAKMNGQGSHVYVALHNDGHLVGTITLLIEQTFVRGGAVAGHIESVVVAKGYEGQGIGG